MMSFDPPFLPSLLQHHLSLPLYTMSTPLPRLYILITGANSGVGLGIATRLLLQLSSPSRGPPSDSFPQRKPFIISPTTTDAQLSQCPYTPNSGVTFILACRSEQRALKAREVLLSKLDKDFLERNGVKEEDREFKRNLEIVWEGLDLSEMRSVYAFVERVKAKYPYLTHLYLNAGVGAWSQIDWLAAFCEFFTNPVKCLTDPDFKLQETGWKSEKDGMGWVWQCGVFGHWCIANSFLPLLLASPLPPRVIWTSSFTSSIAPALDLEDLQCIKTDKSYEATKRQIDLLSESLDKTLQDGPSEGRSILCDPAVTASEIYRPQLGIFLYQVMMLAFYAVRFFGNSQNHPIDVVTGSIAFVHLGLIPLSLVPSPSSSSSRSPTVTSSTTAAVLLDPSEHSVTPSLSHTSTITTDSSLPPSTPTSSDSTNDSGIGRSYKFGSQANRWGTGYVKVAELSYEKEEQRELLRLVEAERTKWERALGEGETRAK
ncbi:hypothetical protein BDY24DRAFT_166273 [Mrakia frigida]|uniref:3-keto-steroid reductase n=1 Tax=Mrakia frigida TaxID=29902 RepID=UPI003FCC18A1